MCLLGCCYRWSTLAAAAVDDTVTLLLSPSLFLLSLLRILLLSLKNPAFILYLYLSYEGISEKYLSNTFSLLLGTDVLRFGIHNCNYLFFSLKPATITAVMAVTHLIT